MAAKLDIKINDKLLKSLEKTLKGAINTRTLKVGFFNGVKNDDKENSPTIAAIARANEFGVPEKNIPARPFMQQTLEAHGFYKRSLAIRLGRVIRGTRSLDGQLMVVGEKMASDIKQTITSGNFSANALNTIAKKGSDKPLIDLGNMRANVSFRID
ncbi:hypothetical protein PsalMR5_04884 (plasmid) [Piscirickettsia salmonis]|uniref:hypothetical protein n=1 Tax=Piscirickettsia salmonis TaxID=1238 RepID=UPI0012BACD2C|nr:hypothetical protein [Piscirickettsia salmonis]QGP57365.1 hypothetical protein PsalSR1_04854 [Piscirickettsia salmonis]QGP66959.1 hypothetical protein PsalMR5_04884 [Piscirickettsia salmonis]